LNIFYPICKYTFYPAKSISENKSFLKKNHHFLTSIDNCSAQSKNNGLAVFSLLIQERFLFAFWSKCGSLLLVFDHRHHLTFFEKIYSKKKMLFNSKSLSRDQSGA